MVTAKARFPTTRQSRARREPRSGAPTACAEGGVKVVALASSPAGSVTRQGPPPGTALPKAVQTLSA